MRYWRQALRINCDKPASPVDDALAQWLDKVKAHLITWPYAEQVDIIQIETGHRVAQYRIRIVFATGGLLQCVERKRELDDGLVTEKYSFHWQNAEGKLIRHWDNAPHHPEISSFPHHRHETDEANVQPHEAVEIFEVLKIIGEALP